jgi:hypothetical protein
LGGSAYVAPRPSAVRLRRNSRPAARQQKHCTTMILTAEGPRLLDLRRIRIRCVHDVTKVLRAAETAIMRFFARFILFIKRARQFRLDRYSKLAKIALSILLALIVCDPSNSDLVDPPKLPPPVPLAFRPSRRATGKIASHLWRINLSSVHWITNCRQGC